jgi:hypothetical protein
MTSKIVGDYDCLCIKCSDDESEGEGESEGESESDDDSDEGMICGHCGGRFDEEHHTIFDYLSSKDDDGENLYGVDLCESCHLKYSKHCFVEDIPYEEDVHSC